MQKVKPIHSQKMRDSARGEDCSLQIASACNHDPSTTVLCHFPDETHGMALKADDLSAGYGCSACHDIADGRVEHWDWNDDTRHWYMRRSQTRTLRRMIEKGVICVR